VAYTFLNYQLITVTHTELTASMSHRVFDVDLKIKVGLSTLRILSCITP
jgi:hypothetical protein